MDKIKEIFVIDKIRILKIFEMLQYSIIFYFLTLIVVDFLNDYIFIKNKDDIEKMSHIKLILTTLLELFIIVIGLFYIRKIALAIPSIPSLIYPKFKSHTTIEYVIHIITVFLFLETLKNLSTKIERIREIDFFKNNVFTDFLIKK